MLVRRFLAAAVLGGAFAAAAPAQTAIGFESFGVPANSFVNNVGGAASSVFTEAGAGFNNNYSPPSPPFGESWDGWALSSVTNNAVGGYGNQYAAIAGGGSRGSATYGVAFAYGASVADPNNPDGSFVDLPLSMKAVSIDVTNTAYAYRILAGLDADAFSRAFGAGDYFRLRITGYAGAGGAGTATGSVDFYLADFRAGATTLVNSWDTVELSALGEARSLRFALFSTDFGTFGINTPAYFAADNLILAPVPEPSALALALAAGAWFALRRRRAAARGSA